MRTIIIPLRNCFDVTFCICSLYFVNGKNKQTNKSVTKLAKTSFKIHLKIIFLIKLKLSKAFGEKIIF